MPGKATAMEDNEASDVVQRDDHTQSACTIDCLAFHPIDSFAPPTRNRFHYLCANRRFRRKAGTNTLPQPRTASACQSFPCSIDSLDGGRIGFFSSPATNESTPVNVNASSVNVNGCSLYVQNEQMSSGNLIRNRTRPESHSSRSGYTDRPCIFGYCWLDLATRGIGFGCRPRPSCWRGCCRAPSRHSRLPPRRRRRPSWGKIR